SRPTKVRFVGKRNSEHSIHKQCGMFFKKRMHLRLGGLPVEKPLEHFYVISDSFAIPPNRHPSPIIPGILWPIVVGAFTSHTPSFKRWAYLSVSAVETDQHSHGFKLA